MTAIPLDDRAGTMNSQRAVDGPLNIEARRRKLESIDPMIMR